MYSELYTRKRSPFLPFAFIVLAVASLAGAGFLYSSTFSPTKAIASKQIDHQIVNATPKQISIYWKTDSKETGWVLFGESKDKLSALAVDERDKGEERGNFDHHLVTLRNLDANKEYYYKIVSGNTIFTEENNVPFSIKTPKTSPPSSTSKPIYGKISDPSGRPVENAVVKIFIQGGTPLITFTKSSGEWLVPLQTVYDLQLANTIQINNQTQVTVEVIGPNNAASKIVTFLQKGSPLPQTIVLGTNYDFREEDTDVLPASTSRQEEEQQTNITYNEIDIVFPRPNAIIPGVQPLIKGKAIPKTRVQVELNSSPMQKFSSIVNERGDWTAYVSRPLLPGTYTMTMYAKNSQNEDVVLSRSFTLTKSGEQVLAEATGPGDLSPSPSPTEEPTPTVEPTNFPSPTVVVASPTGIATASPTLVASGSAIIVTPAPPVSGGNGLLYTIISIGLLVVGGGVIILL